MDINYLRRQHKEVNEVLADLKNRLEPYDKIPENAFALTMLIANIAGKLKIHLSSEDKYLYPGLLKNPDPKVQDTAQMFIEEMGDLAESFDIYKSKYMNAKNIRNSPEDFVSETKTIIKAILKRIEKEESELYTMLQ
ncbi:MAG: hemerythrin domain-containing protein [Zhaonellaceae bacterium]|jgi:hemerythrin-like domain-containing protein|nr:hemerythrin domain-containing protein [Clostridia bacterium]